MRSNALTDLVNRVLKLIRKCANVCSTIATFLLFSSFYYFRDRPSANGSETPERGADRYFDSTQRTMHYAIRLLPSQKKINLYELKKSDTNVTEYKIFVLYRNRRKRLSELRRGSMILIPDPFEWIPQRSRLSRYSFSNYNILFSFKQTPPRRICANFLSS